MASYVGVKTFLLFCAVVRSGLKIRISLMPTFYGYRKFHSPLLLQPCSSTQILLGSSLLVSSVLHPQQIDACRSEAKDCSVLNVCCCLIACKAYRIAIISVYCPLSVSIKSALENFRLVLQGLLPYKNSFVAADVNINLLSNS